MFQRNKFIVLLLVLVSLSVSLSNTLCAQRVLIDFYRSDIKRATSKMLSEVKDIVAPWTGKSAEYTIDYDTFSYDEQNNKIEVYVHYSFLARNILLGLSYGECQIAGKLELYLPIRRIDNSKVFFYWKERNKHIRLIASEKAWRKLNDGLVITY